MVAPIGVPAAASAGVTARTIVTRAGPRHDLAMLRALSALTVIAALAGCSSNVDLSGSPATTPAGATASTEVVKIVTRDRSILVSTRQQSVRATVLDANGKLLARDVPVDELQTIDATSYETVRAGAADREPLGSFRPSTPCDRRARVLAVRAAA